MIITRFTSGMQAPGGVGPPPRLGGLECRHDPRSVGSEGHFPYPVGWSRFFGVAPRGCVRRMGGVTAEEAQSVSVVIPAFNAERTLGAVLDALTHDPQRPDEVIVVDDGSTDLTAQIARAARRARGGRGPRRLRRRGAQPRLGRRDGGRRRLPRLRRRAAARLRRGRSPRRPRVSRRDRRLRPALRAAHGLVVGRPPADRDPVPRARPARAT